MAAFFQTFTIMGIYGGMACSAIQHVQGRNMKSLTISEYIKILKTMSDTRLNWTETATLMKRWDEARTDLNPNARWYGEEEVDNETKKQGTTAPGSKADEKRTKGSK